MDLLSQQPLFSTESTTKGFDLTSGNKWIYPENYPIREYQFTIVKTSLFHNTLVCLPTGLGKTFIAAVVMYNFWRWYPTGLIVFLAPTKPLVAQQIDACHDIMGIPISETIELTGAINQKIRETAWRKKRVIFATPQTFQKDLEKGIIKTDLIKCVVIDEAHKALGKHAYCESVRILHQTNPYYRLLALSATPGSKLDAVQEVIRNLHITHLELRDDTSSDIIPYIHERKLEVIQVELGNDLTRFHERYMQIMDPHLRVLLKNNLIYGATSNITKARIFLARKEFMNRQNKPYNYGSIMKALNILLSMSHANDLLINHGLRAFVHFFQNHSDKFWLKDEPNLSILLDEITEFIGPFPEIKSLMNGDETDIPDNIVFGHEKFNKLREILTGHFEKAAAKNTDTRAIVFIEYRDIVNEVFILLLQLRPLIRPQVFVGQAGLKQKQQKKALDEFRSNSVNVLISTSVGEEGLDVGEVDLIICFDILQHSPTRLVQRMGRTGRKRDGHIIILVTQGREHKTLKNALAKRDSLNSKVLHSSGIIDALGEKSPRMIPLNLNPECLKMRITAIPTTPRSRNQRKKVERTKSKKNNIRNSVNEKKISKNIVSGLNNETKSMEKIKGAMMKFLASTSNKENTNQDSDVIDMKIQGINSMQFKTQMPHNIPIKIKSSDVKLLTSDNESVEFLTLCMLKQSKQEMKIEEKSRKISYMPELYFNNVDLLLNIKIPPVSILNCIRSLTEYISPCSDEFIGVHEAMETEVWEPPDHFSHFANTSRCPESVLINGRFEDILDETSDSDITIFSGDESFIDQQVNWKNNGNTFEDIVPQNNDDNINNINASKSIVIDGAFEDILDESSEEGLIEMPIKAREVFCDTSLNNSKSNSQIIENIDVINLVTPEPEDLDENINVNKNNSSPDYCKTIKDKEEIDMKKNNWSPMDTDLNLNLDFENDFDSWDKYIVKDSRDTAEISSTNRITSHHNTPTHLSNFNVSLTREKSQLIQTMDSQIVDKNNIEDRMSPDLSKSSQQRAKTKTNVPLNTVEQQSIVLESVKETVEKTNSSDEDIFGVESLLLDSDFEDEIIAVENSNVVNSNVINNNSNSNLNIGINPSVEQKHVNSVQSVTTNMDNVSSQKSKKNSVSDNYFLDDIEWNSDFETSSAPITESKYFKSNSNTTLSNSSFIEPLDKSKNSNNLCSNLNFKENKLSETKSKPVKKLINNQDKFLSRIKSNESKDLDSDDDFSSEKIEKIVFRGLENNFSDDEVFSNNPSKLKAGNRLGCSSKKPQSLSTKDLNKCVEPKKVLPEEKNISMKKSSRICATKSTSLDSYPKKKRLARKRGRIKSAFIDDEAEVTLDGIHSLESSNDDDDDDDDDCETDDDLKDFVSHTQYVDTAVDMRAHYLQSVRSPRGPGRFLIKKPKTPPSNMEICSQEIPNEPDTYLYDSFCVEENDEPSEDSDFSLDEVSILTEIEQKLKAKKRKRKNSSRSSQSKRKRIIINVSDDTSEDETERIRAEIANQSIMLKNK